jgi:hypothetical protein
MVNIFALTDGQQLLHAEADAEGLLPLNNSRLWLGIEPEGYIHSE